MDNFYETQLGKETLSDLDLCRTAIRTYLESLYEFSGVEITPEMKRDIENDAFFQAESLATNQSGLRFGAPGWPHAKLVFREPEKGEGEQFFVNPNKMPEDGFKKWQSFVAEKFRAIGLKFFEFPFNS